MNSAYIVERHAYGRWALVTVCGVNESRHSVVQITNGTRQVGVSIQSESSLERLGLKNVSVHWSDISKAKNIYTHESTNLFYFFFPLKIAFKVDTRSTWKSIGGHKSDQCKTFQNPAGKAELSTLTFGYMWSH